MCLWIGTGVKLGLSVSLTLREEHR